MHDDDTSEAKATTGSRQGRAAMPPSIDAGIPRLPSSPPPGWRRCRLGELFDVVARPVVLEPAREYELVVARRSRGGIESRGRLLGSQIKVKQQFAVEADDFLMSNRQISHGGCGIVPPALAGAIVSGEYTVLHPKQGLLLEFLRHYTHSRYFQQICFHSSVGVHVEKLVFRPDVWMNWPIDLPDETEQERITNVLSECDHAIAILEALVMAKRKAKRALMQRLLPAITQRVELLDFVRLRKATQSGGGDSIELENIEGGTGRLLGTTSLGASGGNRFRYKAGDTLFGRLRPYLDKRIFATSEGLCSTEIWVMTPDERLCRPRFLFALSQTPEFKAAANVQSGSKMPRAEWEVVAKTPLPLPSLAEQDRIACALTAADNEIDLLAAQAVALRRQKRGLMQKLLTGGWRVGSVREREAA